ncbi:MAG: ABC transporter ATP-binding protein [Clostridia bacterium]|nr:ABC transporter ATP-binding protein [Clostridia bacterium]
MNAENKTLIQLTALGRTYKNGDIEVKALSEVNLSICAGEFIAVMGASGSGKSTLMNILGCLDKPTEGSYLLEGIDIRSKTDDELSEIRNAKIGFVFQSFNLIPRNSALKNVTLPMVYAKIPKQQRRLRAQELLRDVGLEDRAAHMPNELSGGQKQRVAIARALANDPPIILADEPTGNLDSQSSVEIMNIFSALNTKKQSTIIVVTHEADIAKFCDRILTFKDGYLMSDKSNERRCE